MRKVAVFNDKICDIEAVILKWIKNDNVNIIQIDSIVDIFDEKYMTISILYDDMD